MGDRLYMEFGQVWRYPAKQIWSEDGRFKPSVTDEAKFAGLPSYTVPPPACKCDGSGKRFDYERPDADSQGRVTCPGCSACKPEPKDGAEEVADDLVSEWAYELPNGSRPGGLDTRRLVTRIVSAIRADRAAQPAPSPALGEKVRDLAEYVKLIVPGDSQKGRLAREVLAMLPNNPTR